MARFRVSVVAVAAAKRHQIYDHGVRSARGLVMLAIEERERGSVFHINADALRPGRSERVPIPIHRVFNCTCDYCTGKKPIDD